MNKTIRKINPILKSTHYRLMKRNIEKNMVMFGNIDQFSENCLACGRPYVHLTMYIHMHAHTHKTVFAHVPSGKSGRLPMELLAIPCVALSLRS